MRIIYARFGSKEQMKGVENLPKNITYIKGNELFIVLEDKKKINKNI